MKLCYVLVGSFLLCTLAAMAVPVKAQTLLLTPKYFSNNEDLGTVFLDLDSSGPAGLTQFDLYLGPQDAVLTGYNTVPDPLKFDAYCVDFSHFSYHSPYTVDLLSTDALPYGRPGVSHGGSIAWLYNNYATGALNDNRQAAALQLAIWEAEYDWDGTSFVNGTNSSIDLSSGFFQFGGTVAGVAVDADLISRTNTMLSAWSGKQSEAAWLADPEGQKQDHIGPHLNVPEPGTMSLLLPGMGLVAGLIRYRKGV